MYIEPGRSDAFTCDQLGFRFEFQNIILYVFSASVSIVIASLLVCKIDWPYGSAALKPIRPGLCTAQARTDLAS